MALLAALATLAFCSPARPAATDPFWAPVLEMRAHGLRPAQRLDGGFDGMRLAAIIFRNKGATTTVLKIYTLRGKGKPALVYEHPGVGEIQEFVPLRPTNGFPDFFGDGTPAVLYRSVNRGTRGWTLYVLRYQAPYFRRVGSFPEGRLADLRWEGRREIISESRPLGRWFSVSCGGFETVASQAVAADVQAWDGSAFVSVNDRYPEFWVQRETSDRAALEQAKPSRNEKPGVYLARALTVFFDEAAQGRKQAGWRELSQTLSESGAPRYCRRRVDSLLRQALGVPDGWR